MSFTAAIRALFGNIAIEVINQRVTVTGVRSEVLVNGMGRLFGTTRHAYQLFEIEKHSFSFHEFFLPDVMFLLSEVMAHGRSQYSAVHTATAIHAALMQATWVGQTEQVPSPRINKAKLKDLAYTPLDFQDEFLDAYDTGVQNYRLKGYLFAGAAGSGKTFTSLALMHCVGAEQVIVVCPNNAVQRVWQSNIDTVFKDKQSYWLSSDNKEWTGHERFLVVHYEFLGKFLLRFTRNKSKQLGVILDESHNLNELTSQRTQTFLDLCDRFNPTDTLWLSGTPIKAVSAEAIPLIRCIDPLFDDDAQDVFKKIFRGDQNKAVSILRHRLGLVSFTVPKERLGLTPPEFHDLPISFKGCEAYTLEAIKAKMKAFMLERENHYQLNKPTDEAFYNECMVHHEQCLHSEHDQIEFMRYKESVGLIIQTHADVSVKDDIVFANTYEKNKILPSLPAVKREQFKQVKTIIKYVHLKIQGECLGRVVLRARVECHAHIAQAINYSIICESTDKKTVIFTSYVEVLQAAAQALKKQEFEPILAYSDMDGTLSEVVDKFEKKKQYNPLVATYAMLSTAVPLVMADTMILIDSPYRDYLLQQAVSRIHRLGATTDTQVYTATLDTGPVPNISTRGLDILKWSQQQVNDITGNPSPFEIKSTDLEGTPALEAYILESLQPSIVGTPDYLSW